MRLQGGDWPTFGFADDIRQGLADSRANSRSIVLGTLVRIDGTSPRPLGTQMLFDGDAALGYFSGGCVEADIANHAMQVASSGTSKRLVYGRGSPWIDIQLACGGTIEILLESIPANDAAVSVLLEGLIRRRSVLWSSDGANRQARLLNEQAKRFTADGGRYWLCYEPIWRVCIVGGDPIALATADLADKSGFETILVRPFGPSTRPPIQSVSYLRDDVATAIGKLNLDQWTAVVSATHDDEIDDVAILRSLTNSTGYVGVVGAARKVAGRRERLAGLGLPRASIARLHAPIGAVRCGKGAWEVAVSIVADIMQHRMDRSQFTDGQASGAVRANHGQLAKDAPGSDLFRRVAMATGATEPVHSLSLTTDLIVHDRMASTP